MTSDKSPRAPKVLDSFDDWALLSARTGSLDSSERRAVLEQLDIADDFHEANRHWSGVIGEELAVDGERPHMERYQRVCQKELERQRSGADSIDLSDLGPPPSGAPASELARGPLTFRTKLMQGLGLEGPDEAEPQTVRVEHKALTGDEAAVVLPAAAQTSTLASSLADSTLTDARAALKWPVDKYAKFCAELDAPEADTAVVCASYSLDPARVVFVRDAWERRLAANPELQARWVELTLQYQRK